MMNLMMFITLYLLVAVGMLALMDVNSLDWYNIWLALLLPVICCGVGIANLFDIFVWIVYKIKEKLNG